MTDTDSVYTINRRLSRSIPTTGRGERETEEKRVFLGLQRKRNFDDYYCRM